MQRVLDANDECWMQMSSSLPVVVVVIDCIRVMRCMECMLHPDTVETCLHRSTAVRHSKASHSAVKSDIGQQVLALHLNP